MELTEKDYAEAFGVEMEQQPQDAAEGDQSQADGREGTGTPVADTAPESAQEGPEDTREPEDAEGGAEGAEAPEKPPMTPEERHRQAAARRAREDAVRREAEQRRVDAVYAEMFAGQTSPYTGKPITTEAEYRAYIAEKQRRANEEALQRSGIDPAVIRNVVDQQLAPMQQQLQMAQMAAMRERARQVKADAEGQIARQLKVISGLDPSIKSLDDIAAMETAEAFNGYIKKGLTMEEAFRLANAPAIEARKLAAAKAAAINGVAGKGHLAPVQSGSGREPVEVPADARAAYLEMMPGASEAEIRAEYAKFLQSMK